MIIIDRQLDNELLVMEIVRALFVEGVIPNHEMIITRVLELQAFWDQMHGGRGE